MCITNVQYKLAAWVSLFTLIGSVVNQRRSV